MGLSFDQILLFLLKTGNFYVSWSNIFKVDTFLSVITETEFDKSAKQLLLGNFSFISLPCLECLIVCSNLFSLYEQSKRGSLNFSLGKRYNCFRIKVLCNSPSADGRSLGEAVKQRRINASKSCEQTSGILSHMPVYIFLRRAGKSTAIKGGLKEAISQSTHPKDQISHFPVQGRSPQTSGLAQQGVPVWVQARPLLLTFETFRSPNRASLSSPHSKILALLTSLWKTLRRCSYLSPKSIWMAILHISYYFMRSLFFWCVLMYELRSPPLANSVTRTSDASGSSKKAYLQASTQGWLMLASILISLRQLAISLELLLLNLIFLSAQKAPSCFRLALQTEAQLP